MAIDDTSVNMCKNPLACINNSDSISQRDEILSARFSLFLKYLFIIFLKPVFRISLKMISHFAIGSFSWRKSLRVSATKRLLTPQKLV
jgi:hypothetical protein